MMNGARANWESPLQAMDWSTRFAERTTCMKRSAVRELLKLTSHPEMISFAGGLPAAELFPLDKIQAATRAVLARTGAKSLQYGETEGVAELRDWIAARFSTPTLRVKREQVMIVTGAQQGLDLIGRVLLDPGDRVVVENPTYMALLSAWRPLGVEFLPVSGDEEGLHVDDLKRQLARRPRLLYSIPTFQNPQGSTLSLQRRQAVIRALCEANVPVVEDSPYVDLRYEGEPMLTLFALAAETGGFQDHVLHVGTFSKILMPGLRLGWVLGPEEVIDKLVQAKQATDLHTSAFNQHLALELIREGFLEEHIPVLRREYARRRDAMLAALRQSMPPDVSWTRPDGGMFLMLRLPRGLDAEQLLPHALEQNVAFVPGADFHVDGTGSDTLRLNFTNVSPNRIAEGVKRLARLVENHTFASTSLRSHLASCRRRFTLVSPV
jgi:2-aminoadipate transaminase